MYFYNREVADSEYFTWEESNKREWKPPTDSYTKLAHELFSRL